MHGSWIMVHGSGFTHWLCLLQIEMPQIAEKVTCSDRGGFLVICISLLSGLADVIFPVMWPESSP
jgi:uncharacterized membrane protein